MDVFHRNAFEGDRQVVMAEIPEIADTEPDQNRSEFLCTRLRNTQDRNLRFVLLTEIAQRSDVLNLEPAQRLADFLRTFIERSDQPIAAGFTGQITGDRAAEPARADQNGVQILPR